MKHIHNISYLLQLQSLDFPKQWLQGHPSGHSHAPAIADLTSVDIFAIPIPNINIPKTMSDIYIFLIYDRLLVIKLHTKTNL